MMEAERTSETSVENYFNGSTSQKTILILRNSRGIFLTEFIYKTISER
jgi:hypothetical protein